MSYLVQYARRPDSIAARTRAARVDEHMRLNRPGLYGDAFVRVLVEDTTRRRRRRNRDPRLVLQIADCMNTINLEFSLETARAARELALQGRDAARCAPPVPRRPRRGS